MIWISIPILMVSMILHELGHFVIMRRYGVEIERITIGIGGPSWRLPVRSSIPIYVTPIWLGASVMMSEQGLNGTEELSYRQQAHIDGIGIAVNLILAEVLLLAGLIVNRLSDPSRLPAIYYTVALVLVGLGPIMIIWSERFCAYVLPVLSVVVLLAIPI